MAILTRDERDLQTVVGTWAQANGASEETAQRTRDKLLSVLEWLRALRRLVHTSRRYDISHPTRVEATDQALDGLKPILRRYGALTLHLSLTAVFSEEGIALPSILDADAEGHGQVFHSLSRDGVTKITFKPGIERDEIEHLVEVVAHDGRRDGDNAVTWLWDGRLKHIRVELDPTLAPHAAALAASRGGNDPIVQTYLLALKQAGPDARTRDERPRITTAQADALAALGVTHELVALYQQNPQLEAGHLAIAAEVAAQAQAEYSNLENLRARAASVRQRAMHGGLR